MESKLMEHKEVAQIDAAFYEALNSLFRGEMAPMESVWSHADDITYLGPQGTIRIGWDEVRDSLQEQAVQRLGGEIIPEGTHVIEQGDIAITQCYEMGTNIVRGETHAVSIRATNIYRREEGSWRMISHQTDKLPFLSEE